MHTPICDRLGIRQCFGPRFGLYAVDYETGRRTPRRSAEIYRRLIASRRSGTMR